jgi:hypothetical protein
MEEANLDLAGVNSTFVTLIPKCDTLQQISDYRPVTLQQTSHEQFANKDDTTITVFIKGRSIIQNFTT